MIVLPWYWRAAALIVLIGAVWGHGFVHGVRHEEPKVDAARAELAMFRDQVAAAGAEQNARTKAHEAEDQRKAKESDHAATKALQTVGAMYADAARRLSADPGGGGLLAPGSGAAGPPRALGACGPDAARGMAEALRRLEAGSLAVLRRGDEALADRASWGEFERGRVR